MTRAGRRRGRRGFTLLEVMLAAILGTMVVIACLGLFRAIEQQTLAGRQRFNETLEVGMIHSTAERAIQLLLMSDAPPPVEPPAGAAESEEESQEGDADADAGRGEGSGAAAGRNDRGEDGQRGRSARGRRDRGAQGRGDRAGDAPAAGDSSDTSREGGSAGGGGSTGARGSSRRSGDAAAAGPIIVPETPRFDLAFDPAMTGSMEVYDRNGNRRVIPPQRLEVALRSAPVFVPSASGPVETEEDRERESIRERRAREQRENDAPASTETTVAPGIRGAFELVFEAGPDLDGDGVGGTYSLWWRQIAPDPAGGQSLADAVAAEQIEWPDGLGPGRIRLASNLKRVHWQVYRGGEWRDEWSATWVDDLPAYVSLEIETAAGTNHQWLLEVGWSVGKEPGTQSTVTPEADAEPDGQGGQNRGRGNAEPIRNHNPNRVPAAGDNAPGGRGRGRSGR